jgi:hypothetical protein
MSGGLRSALGSNDFCCPVDLGVISSGATSFTTVTGSVSTNVKGASVAIGSPLPCDAALLFVSSFGSVGSRSSLFDIEIGPSGSQQTLFPNIHVRQSLQYDFYLPCSIPAGTQLWIRQQCTVASDVSHSFRIIAFSASFAQQEGFQGGDAIGVVLSASSGTTLTAPSTANTKPTTFTTLGTTLNDYDALLVCLMQNTTTSSFAVDLAIGSSGSEQVIEPNMMWNSSAGGFVRVFPLAVPAGVRLSSRAQASVASATTFASVVGLYR